MFKWVIQITMPSGNKFILSSREGCLALIPVDPTQGGVVRGVTAWDTAEEAERAYTELRENPVGDNLFDTVTVEFVQLMLPH